MIKTYENKLLLVTKSTENILFGMLLLTVIINSFLVIHELVDWVSMSNYPIIIPGNENSPSFTISEQPSASLINMKIRMLVALIIGTSSFFLKKSKLFIPCIISLWIIGEYIFWWLRSYNLYINAEAIDFTKISHTIYLINGTWWDVWILLVTIFLFMYTLKLLYKNSPLLN